MRTGANGIGATANAGAGRMPVSEAEDQTIAVQQASGKIFNIDLEGGMLLIQRQP